LIEFILALGNPAGMGKISLMLVRKPLGNAGEILGEIIGKTRQLGRKSARSISAIPSLPPSQDGHKNPPLIALYPNTAGRLKEFS
jgi:hypothetical protein